MSHLDLGFRLWPLVPFGCPRLPFKLILKRRLSHSYVAGGPSRCTGQKRASSGIWGMLYSYTKGCKDLIFLEFLASKLPLRSSQTCSCK